MRDVLIFQGIRATSLTGVISAERAYPTDVPTEWRLDNVLVWETDTENAEPVSLPAMTLELDLIPEQLSYLGIYEFNIPTGPLLRIADRPTARNADDVRTALWRRRTAWLIPGALALMAVALARAGFAGRVAVIPRLIAVGALGYVSVVSIKVFWVVGELGLLPAPLAVLLPIALSLGVAAVFALRRA
jgi:lipopolysaccharide export LptBFGC system permease protein LptF